MTQAGPGDGLQAPRWPALDGLRAVAVLAVIVYHFGLLSGGFLGVDLFFVLSGYLITSLLIREWDRRGGRISFRDFYVRRILRLFPALACVIAVTVVLTVFMELSRPISDRPYVVGTLEGQGYPQSSFGWSWTLTGRCLRPRRLAIWPDAYLSVRLAAAIPV